MRPRRRTLNYGPLSTAGGRDLRQHVLLQRRRRRRHARRPRPATREVPSAARRNESGHPCRRLKKSNSRCTWPSSDRSRANSTRACVRPRIRSNLPRVRSNHLIARRDQRILAHVPGESAATGHKNPRTSKSPTARLSISGQRMERLEEFRPFGSNSPQLWPTRGN